MLGDRGTDLGALGQADVRPEIHLCVGQRASRRTVACNSPFATWVALTQSFAQQQLERELLSSPDALGRLRTRLAPAER